MTAYDHLFALNARLLGVLDGEDDALPDAHDLDALLATRAVLLDAAQRSVEPLPPPLQEQIIDQHRRIDTLLEAHMATVQQNMQRLDLLDRARSEYATLPARHVLRSRLDA